MSQDFVKEKVLLKMVEMLCCTCKDIALSIEAVIVILECGSNLFSC